MPAEIWSQSLNIKGHIHYYMVGTLDLSVCFTLFSVFFFKTRSDSPCLSFTALCIRGTRLLFTFSKWLAGKSNKNLQSYFKRKVENEDQNQAALTKLMCCTAGFYHLPEIHKTCHLIFTKLFATTSRSTVITTDESSQLPQKSYVVFL